MGNSVGHGEDGSDRGNCVGEDRGGGDRVCENRGRVCEKRGGGGGYWEGEGMGVCGVGQQNGGVGFRPGQAKRGNGENSKLK